MRKFSLSDYHQISQWFQKRGMNPPKVELLPPTGVIEDGVAAGFLIKTDCKIGILDFFITNPDVSKEARAGGLEGITDMLIATAKWSGLLGVKCDTKFKNIEALAIKKDFASQGDVLSFYKEF